MNCVLYRVYTKVQVVQRMGMGMDKIVYMDIWDWEGRGLGGPTSPGGCCGAGLWVFEKVSPGVGLRTGGDDEDERER
jgi:hypothetical protein